MALLSCLECDKDISDQAASCPHCGSPTNYAKKGKEKKEGQCPGSRVFINDGGWFPVFRFEPDAFDGYRFRRARYFDRRIIYIAL